MIQVTASHGQSLQSRLLWTVLSVVGLVWLLVLAATWVDTDHEMGELLDAHLSEAAALVAAQPQGDLSHPAETSHTLLPDQQHRVVLQVWQGQRLVLRSANAPEEALAASGATGFSNTHLRGERWRVFSTQGPQGDRVIHVAEQEKSRTDVAKAGLRSVLWPMAIAFPLLVLGIWWGVRQAVRPLRELGDLVARRSPDQATALPLTRVPREALPLVHELNRLFARTADLIESERRFTADAAHELRTPMAAIRMQAQVAQGATDDAERAEALAATVVGCDRATHLMEQLLQLARLEAQASVEPVLTPVQPCLANVLADLAPTVAQRQTRLQVDLAGAPGLCAPIPLALAHVLLRNLLDNALRYSPPGATVRISGRTTPGQAALLCIEDSGPGVSDGDMARLGDRFFRVLGTGQSGSGLGWSIVRRITRMHGVRVAVQRSQDLGGLQVSLSWATDQTFSVANNSIQ